MGARKRVSEVGLPPALSVIASSYRPRPPAEGETAGVRRGVPLNAGSSRREERRPARFLPHFEPFQGVADRKISLPAFAAPPISRERRRGWTRRRDSFRFGETVAAVASVSSERGRIWPDSNSVSFVFKGLQGGKFSLPPSRRRAPDAWTAASRSRRRAFRRPRAAVRRPAEGALLGGAASAICESRPRAVDDSARRRRARHAAAGFLGEHGHGGFSSSEVERRE